MEGRILDFGCGSKPYLSLFTNATQYIGVDIENGVHDHSNENVDVFYNGIQLPFADEEFDGVFSSEVLEHVPNIQNSISEINRVLKTEGYILISIPFVYEEHEIPYDFRRLTVNGLKQILEESNFEIVASDKLGSSVDVITQLIMNYVRDIIHSKNKYINIVTNMIFIFPICLSGIILSIILPVNKKIYFNTVILARKKNHDRKFRAGTY
jgi:SAM-dependent methyltransferase